MTYCNYYDKYLDTSFKKHVLGFHYSILLGQCSDDKELLLRWVDAQDD